VPTDCSQIASICTPQTHQLLEQLQRDEAAALGIEPTIRQLVKPVKTRWNSYFDTFMRAIELHGPLDSYIEQMLREYSTSTTTTRRRRTRDPAVDAIPPQLFIRERVLSRRDWVTISEYVKLLKPFAEATRLLEGRGKHGRRRQFKVICVMPL
jgi:hypothetical protein